MYNAKEYLKEHPGGADSILLASGDDATDDFVTIHSDDAKRKLAEVRPIPYSCRIVYDFSF